MLPTLRIPLKSVLISIVSFCLVQQRKPTSLRKKKKKSQLYTHNDKYPCQVVLDHPLGK